ncbi:uncharacterized protein Tco025E_01472 [Trypanosoma conorhini]|uniref:Uncharacterized protein n=1 Tax=Trypanosoma conorhini TaxID=83891 RepID=A0A422Q8G9_9TRYP|nr:uncharacterized protein Tco025E_01472 [Trypanosoma conorhini]RNF26256.1 hypothetical protein Tco025E_01472 [Trypanosoma conorhini]
MPAGRTAAAAVAAAATAETDALPPPPQQRQEEPRDAEAGDALPPPPGCLSASVSASAAVPSVVPRLRLEACGVGGASSGPDMTTSFAARDALPSLRARFEELRTTPRMRSPRLGRPIAAYSARSVGVRGGSRSRASPDAVSPRGGAALLQERADLLQRVHDLEDRLKEAHHRNPSMAEVQLMRDEMTAAKQELLALRAEHSQLLEQTKRCALYRLNVPRESQAQREAGDDAGAVAMTIGALEEQLHLAHARIRQLETQAALSALRTLDAAAAAAEQGSDWAPAGAASPLPTGDDVGGAGGIAAAQRQQERLEEALRELRLQRDALAASEERLNQALHLHHAMKQRMRQLQEELASVWGRLESAEYRLKLTLEEREDRAEAAGDAAARASLPRRSRLGAASLQQELRQLRQRDLESRQTVERLRVELDMLKRRQAEERQRSKELRAARTAMLARLEKTFAESLRRQECDLRAIPEALARARKEMEQLRVRRS